MSFKNKSTITILLLLFLSSCAHPSQEMLDNYGVNYELQKEMDKQYAKFALFRSFKESKTILEKSKTKDIQLKDPNICSDNQELLVGLCNSNFSEKELLIILICKVSKLESDLRDRKY